MNVRRETCVSGKRVNASPLGEERVDIQPPVGLSVSALAGSQLLLQRDDRSFSMQNAVSHSPIV